MDLQLDIAVTLVNQKEALKLKLQQSAVLAAYHLLHSLSACLSILGMDTNLRVTDTCHFTRKNKKYKKTGNRKKGRPNSALTELCTSDCVLRVD